MITRAPGTMTRSSGANTSEAARSSAKSGGKPATQTQIDWANEQWAHAETLLFDKNAGCALCHADIQKAARKEGLPDFGQPTIHPARRTPWLYWISR